jgi:hypothetical protein
VCPKCGGIGKRAYGDTTTWRGGMGGQQITTDVCDLCWGSGSKRYPWTSWKTIKNMLDWVTDKTFDRVRGKRKKGKEIISLCYTYNKKI